MGVSRGGLGVWSKLERKSPNKSIFIMYCLPALKRENNKQEGIFFFNFLESLSIQHLPPKYGS